MSWTFYLGAVAFFSVVFTVFYSVAWSVLLGVYENYLRFYQKADLQWTGSDSRFPRPRIKLGWVILVGFLSAWSVVHFIILPRG